MSGDYVALLMLGDNASRRGTDALVRTGLRVQPVQGSAKSVQDLGRDPPALIVLDGRGVFRLSLQLCHLINSSPGLSDVPLVLWAGTITHAERLQVYDAGVDEVIGGTVLTDGDVSKLSAILRSRKGARRTISYADIELDLDGYRVRRGQKAMPLSLQQLSLLRLFLERPETVLTQEQIGIALWGRDDIPYDTVRACVQRLRTLLRCGSDPEVIRTVRGRGWSLDPALAKVESRSGELNSVTERT